MSKRRRSKEVVLQTYNGKELFIMKKDRSKWYLLGKTVDNTTQWPIMFSTNKKRLTDYIKSLGLEAL